jgi:chromatin segregation and condensation protein Rec8/ScpA/Scc1 (kleisin family)
MNWLKLYLQEKKELHFQELFSSLQSKVLIIVTFLALLELTHRGILGVRQNESTLDIFVFYLGEKTKEGPEIEATRS